jgi:hypothetical protein
MQKAGKPIYYEKPYFDPGFCVGFNKLFKEDRRARGVYANRRNDVRCKSERSQLGASGARFAGNNSIIINANDFSKQPSETEFEIYLRDVNGAGVYQLNQSTSRHPYGASASYGYYVQRKLHPLNEWMTGPNAGGTVTITKWDPTTKILAGHFQFQAANMDNPSDVLSVTEGRFDLIVE